MKILKEGYFTDDSTPTEIRASKSQSTQIVCSAEHSTKLSALVPSMLRIQNQNPIPSCSKASRVFPSCRRQSASLPTLHFHRAPRGDSLPVVTPFMRDTNQMSRNFAQACYHPLFLIKKWGFLYIAIEFGPSLAVFNDSDVWPLGILKTQKVYSFQSFLLIIWIRFIIVCHISKVILYHSYIFLPDFQHIVGFY